MKQLLMILGFTVMMISCKNKTADNTQVLSATQQTEYEEFLKWKADKENEKTKTVVVTKTVDKVSTTPVNTTVPQTQRKKGWSKAAKGTVIGAGTGIVAGAIINKKNRGVGALVGGLLGAGAGYGIGRSMDKKDGRN